MPWRPQPRRWLNLHFAFGNPRSRAPRTRAETGIQVLAAGTGEEK